MEENIKFLWFFFTFKKHFGFGGLRVNSFRNLESVVSNDFYMTALMTQMEMFYKVLYFSS